MYGKTASVVSATRSVSTASALSIPHVLNS